MARIGPMHQAGSDSLLTAQTFFRLCTVSFNGLGNLSDEKFKGELFGCVSVSSFPVLSSFFSLSALSSPYLPTPFFGPYTLLSLPSSLLRLGHNHTVYRNKMQATNRQQQGHGHGGKEAHRHVHSPDLLSVPPFLRPLSFLVCKPHF